MSSSAGLKSLLPPEAWQALLAGGAVRQFAKGEVLMRQGEPGSYVFVLAAGRVKVARVDADGNEFLLAVRGVADIIGELAVLGGGMRSATVTALVPCITYVLSAAAFLRIIRERRVEHILLRYLISRQRESDDARAELAGLTALERVGRVMLRLAFQLRVASSLTLVSPNRKPLLRRGCRGLPWPPHWRRCGSAGLWRLRRRSLVIRDLAKLRAEFR